MHWALAFVIIPVIFTGPIALLACNSIVSFDFAKPLTIYRCKFKDVFPFFLKKEKKYLFANFLGVFILNTALFVGFSFCLKPTDENFKTFMIALSAIYLIRLAFLVLCTLQFRENLKKYYFYSFSEALKFMEENKKTGTDLKYEKIRILNSDGNKAYPYFWFSYRQQVLINHFEKNKIKILMS